MVFISYSMIFIDYSMGVISCSMIFLCHHRYFFKKEGVLREHGRQREGAGVRISTSGKAAVRGRRRRKRAMCVWAG